MARNTTGGKAGKDKASAKGKADDKAKKKGGSCRPKA